MRPRTLRFVLRVFSRSILPRATDCQLPGRHRVGFTNHRRVSTDPGEAGPAPLARNLLAVPESHSREATLRVLGEIMNEQAMVEDRLVRIRVALEGAGAVLSRYGLVVILLLIGILKFTPAEADGIQPLVAHSPFMSWMYFVLSKQGVSNFIGIIELLVALLLALRPISPRASFVGSLGAIATFLLTTSFLFTTPGAIELGHGVEILGGAGQFLIKDLVLLGASFWTAAEALRAANGKRTTRKKLT